MTDYTTTFIACTHKTQSCKRLVGRLDSVLVFVRERDHLLHFSPDKFLNDHKRNQENLLQSAIYERLILASTWLPENDFFNECLSIHSAKGYHHPSSVFCRRLREYPVSTRQQIQTHAWPLNRKVMRKIPHSREAFGVTVACERFIPQPSALVSASTAIPGSLATCYQICFRLGKQAQA